MACPITLTTKDRRRKPSKTPSGKKPNDPKKPPNPPRTSNNGPQHIYIVMQKQYDTRHGCEIPMGGTPESGIPGAFWTHNKAWNALLALRERYMGRYPGWRWDVDDTRFTVNRWKETPAEHTTEQELVTTAWIYWVEGFYMNGDLGGL